MPAYCFTSRTGETIERFYSMKPGPPKVVRYCGERFTRDIVSEHRGHVVCQAWKEPMKAWTMAVHPKQRKELSDFLKKAGVPTYVDKKGVPHLRSREHLNRVLKARGMTNLDAGYGDYAGGKYDGPPPPKSARREYERLEDGREVLVKDCSLVDEPDRDVRKEMGEYLDRVGIGELYQQVRSHVDRLPERERREINEQVRRYREAVANGA